MGTDQVIDIKSCKVKHYQKKEEKKKKKKNGWWFSDTDEELFVWVVVLLIVSSCLFWQGDQVEEEEEGRRRLAEEICNATFCCTPVEEDKEGWVVALEWLLIVLLVALSGLFSGLTLGLMSLDLVGLEIVIGGDPDSKDAQYARAIQPIRRKGNLLLCTLLLGNVSVNAALSIFLADYTSGVAGFLISTAVIVVFGEIFPQAACSRHALRVGANSIYIVRFFLVILYPVAFPLSFVLDKIFQEEIGSIYSSGELNKLVQIHLKHEQLDVDQAKMMGGALDLKDKNVSDVMTAFDDMFMLESEAVLNFSTMSQIFQCGYSRIPVYEGNRNNVIGLLLTKDLILIDPEDCTTVKSVIQFFGRNVKTFWPDTPLSTALKEFRSGGGHLGIVNEVNNQDDTKDPFYEVVGCVTLEDIIEEILQEEILDETDQDERPVVDRATFDFARLRLLDTHRKNNLSDEEVNAITAHLCQNVSVFAAEIKSQTTTKAQVHDLVKDCAVLDVPVGEKLYTKGKPITHCTLILSGKMDISSGNEGFRSTAGPWSLVGQSCLENPALVGDFSAIVSEGVRCIRISANALRKITDQAPSSFMALEFSK